MPRAPADGRPPMMPVMPDNLMTPRLRLRRWRLADAALFKEVIDGDLEHLRVPEASPLKDAEERMARFESEFDAGTAWLYASMLRVTNAVVGGCGLHPRIGPDGLEVSYWLRRSATGSGYATEAAAALTRVAFATVGIERVQIRCDSANSASAAIARRLGFRHIATVEKPARTGFEQHRTMVWETTRPEFTGRPQ